jgi:predicted transcriptional regulator
MIDFACKRFDVEQIIKCGLGLTKAELSLFNFLINQYDWKSSKEISDEIKLDLSTVQRGLKKLFEKDIIERRQNNKDNGGYEFIYLTRSRKEIKKILSDIINSWINNVDKNLDEWINKKVIE